MVYRSPTAQPTPQENEFFIEKVDFKFKVDSLRQYISWYLLL